MSMQQLHIIAPGGCELDTAWFLSQLDRAGLSQADLARHLRLAPSAVSRMLKGERQMKLLEAVQVSAFLGVTQDEVQRHAGGNIDAPTRAAPAAPARRGRPPRPGPIPLPPSRAEPIPIRSAGRGGGDQ